jgi:hypothetical protein
MENELSSNGSVTEDQDCITRVITDFPGKVIGLFFSGDATHISLKQDAGNQCGQNSNSNMRNLNRDMKNLPFL